MVEALELRIKDCEFGKIKILIERREYEGEIIRKNGGKWFIGKVTDRMDKSRVSKNKAAMFGPKTKIEITKDYMEKDQRYQIYLNFVMRTIRPRRLVKDCGLGKEIMADVDFGDGLYFSINGEIAERKNKKWFIAEGPYGKTVRFGPKTKIEIIKEN